LAISAAFGAFACQWLTEFEFVGFRIGSECVRGIKRIGSWCPGVVAIDHGLEKFAFHQLAEPLPWPGFQSHPLTQPAGMGGIESINIAAFMI